MAKGERVAQRHLPLRLSRLRLGLGVPSQSGHCCGVRRCMDCSSLTTANEVRRISGACCLSWPVTALPASTLTLHRR